MGDAPKDEAALGHIASRAARPRMTGLPRARARGATAFHHTTHALTLRLKLTPTVSPPSVIVEVEKMICALVHSRYQSR